MNYCKTTLKILETHNVKHFTKLIRNCSKLSLVSTHHDNLIIRAGQNVEQYPLVWLRDNCTCSECFHQASYSRIIDWNKFKTEVAVKTIEKNKTNDGVIIEWDDNHKSLFSFKWLNERSFSKDNQNKHLDNCLYKPKKFLWDGKDFSKIVKKYDYQDVMSSDKSLYSWIQDLAVYGAVFLENATFDTKANRRLADKIAFVRKTHYEEEFHVSSKPDTSNVAYLSNMLQLHTDLPYYEYIPGVINLHCISQAEGEGGESLLCDGIYVAEKLRKQNKPVFNILSTVEVNWLDIGQEEGRKFHSELRAPMISLDLQGNVEKVRHSVPQRDSRFSVDIKIVKPWYQALRVFVDMLNAHTYKFKLKPGEMYAFDNTRMVHGRERYQDSARKQRSIIGLYMDWDELHSKLRVLKDAITLSK